MRQDHKTIEKTLLDYILKKAPELAEDLAGSEDPQGAVELLKVILLWKINELQGLAAGHTSSKPPIIETEAIILLDHASNANPLVTVMSGKVSQE